MDTKKLAALRGALKSLVPAAQAVIALDEALGDEAELNVAIRRRDSVAAEHVETVAKLDAAKTALAEAIERKKGIDFDAAEVQRRLELHRTEIAELRRKVGAPA
jgi:hypothetical protein